MGMLKVGCVAAVIALITGGAAQAIPMSGLELWLKADAGVTTSGGSVTAWQDQTGGTVYNLTQATATKRPSLVSSWGYKNMPALSFDGVDDYVIDTANSLDLTAGLTIFIVAQNDVRKNYNGLFKLAQPATPENATSDLEIYWQAGSTDAGSGNAVYAVNRSTGTGAFGALQGANNPPPVGQPYIYDVFAGGSLSQERTNNVLAASSASAVLPGDATNRPAVGLGFNNFTIDGYIAEVLVYNRVLTSGERTEVYNYLSDRYIPEPASLALLAGGAVLVLRRRAGRVTDWKHE
jgi:hypothetical protein